MVMRPKRSSVSKQQVVVGRVAVWNVKENEGKQIEFIYTFKENKLKTYLIKI